MSRWFRLYDDTINNPKALKLSDKSFRIWIGILCIASKNGGALPSFDDMAIMLRVKQSKLQPELEKLIAAELIDHDDDGMRPHDWTERQYKSDVSTERVKRFRNGKRNVSETPPETEADTEQKEEDSSSENVSRETSVFAFESGVIRLKGKDFNGWVEAFPNLDLKAELLSLTQWAGEQPPGKWFFAVSSALAKRNREQKLKLAQATAPPGQRELVDVNDPKWRERHRLDGIN